MWWLAAAAVQGCQGRGFLIKLMQGEIKSIAFLVFVSAVVGLGAGELVEAVEAGAAARLEAQQLHHGRVGNAFKEIVILINLY